MIEVQHAPNPPADFHYRWPWGEGDAHALDTAKDYMVRRGCTLVIHCGEDRSSYGVIEPIATVQQRVRTPRYD